MKCHQNTTKGMATDSAHFIIYDLKTWTPFTKNNLTLSTGTKVVLFSGRVGPVEQSLFDIAKLLIYCV